MPADLIAYLRARLAEDEAAARAASPSPWYPKSPDELRIGEYGWSFGTVKYREEHLAAETADCEQGKTDALHVARFADPATVLSDIALKRSILDAWEDASREPGPEGSYAWVLIRDVAIRPWLRQYAGRDDFDAAWTAEG